MTVGWLVAVIRTNNECIAADSMHREIKRCEDKEKIPSNSSSTQHCTYVQKELNIAAIGEALCAVPYNGKYRLINIIY